MDQVFSKNQSLDLMSSSSSKPEMTCVKTDNQEMTLLKSRSLVREHQKRKEEDQNKLRSHAISPIEMTVLTKSNIASKKSARLKLGSIS